jgi:hypothetical protein
VPVLHDGGVDGVHGINLLLCSHVSMPSLSPFT